MPQLHQLTAQLDRLAQIDPGPFPVISLYLNLQADNRGRDRFDAFVRKALAERVATYPASAPERESLAADAAKIDGYLRHVRASTNGLALFACAAMDLFEPVQLAAPIEEHRLFISDQPHLYPLARLMDQYPRYLALLADSHAARIFVFAANTTERADRIENLKTKRHKMGGWAQARYQRHVENYHLHHAKDVVDAVARIAREERIDRLIVSGDEVIVPLLKEQMPKELAARIIDVARMDMNAPEREVVETTLAALREKDQETDRERVDALLDAYRSNGLGCVGVEATRHAFELGQVDELVITASPETIKGVKSAAGDQQPDRSAAERAADELVALASKTAAKIRFIEDASLLAPVGGVGAFLRFKL